MIILRLTPGGANSINKFCAAYALSRRLDEELIIDIGKCQNYEWGYVIDFLNIPTYTKYSHYCNDSSPLYMLNDDVFIAHLDEYPDIRSAAALRQLAGDKTIVLDDWFMDQLKFYDDYMGELRPMLTWRGMNGNIEAFRRLISGRISVGVHIRRTDMLHASFAIPTEDNYYKAAIEYCRSKIGKDVLFCVFSDDIEWAEDFLGEDENIKYIHFIGYDDADVEELICLSLCDHRVRPRSSSYSDLADRINGDENRITVWQGDVARYSLGERAYNTLKGMKHWGKRRILTKLFKNNYQEFREELRRYDWNRNNFRLLDGNLIDKYAVRYAKKDVQCASIESIMNPALSLENASRLLEAMREFELDYRVLSFDEEIEYRYRKFKCLYLIGEYERAIAQADYVWGHKIKSEDFREEYASTLEKTGVVREAELLRVNKRNIRFVIISSIPSVYMLSPYGSGELAISLAKSGFDVDIVWNALNSDEEMYQRNSEYLSTWHGVCLGCRQYLYKDVVNNGVSEFIREIREEADDENVCTVVISRDPATFRTAVDNVHYIWIDNSDEYDLEREFYLEAGNDVQNIVDSADYIISSHSELYADMNIPKSKIIEYCNKTYQEPYWEIGRRWQQHDCHRLSERTINMCMAVIEKLS